MKSKNIKNIKDYLGKIGTDKKYYFRRGSTVKKRWKPCVSVFWRRSRPDDAISTLQKEDEVKWVTILSRIFLLLREKGISDHNFTKLIIDARHQSLIMPFLDFTKNPLIALWFAVADGKKGKVYCVPNELLFPFSSNPEEDLIHTNHFSPKQWTELFNSYDEHSPTQGKYFLLSDTFLKELNSSEFRAVCDNLEPNDQQQKKINKTFEGIRASFFKHFNKERISELKWDKKDKNLDKNSILELDKTLKNIENRF